MEHIAKEGDRITTRDRINHNIKINKAIPKGMKNVHKFKDNHKLNMKKVKNEQSVPKKIAEAKKINRYKPVVVEEEKDLPREVVAKLVSVEGEQLQSEIVLPIESNHFELPKHLEVPKII